MGKGQNGQHRNVDKTAEIDELELKRELSYDLEA
jgi:hypothetical protein